MGSTIQAPGIDTAALRAKYLAERDKRLRADGEAQYLAAKGELAGFADDPHALAVPPRAAVEEDVDVVVVGGGFAGLLTAAKLRDAGMDRFHIVEQGADFGGTWYWNRYPGVRCDIESYIYMPLLEEVGTVPTERYATGGEIFAHCQAIGRHYCLYDRTLFGTRVTRIAWDEARARWSVVTDRGDRLAARFLTIGQGPLAKVKLPAIPGLQSFEGRMFHSSRWDWGYTGQDLSGLNGKRVAVVGTGATAVQIVPAIVDHAGHLNLFQRTPSAIDARHNQPTDEAWFRAQPKGWLKERRANFLAVISGHPVPDNHVADRWTHFWRRFTGLMQEHFRPGGDVDPHELMERADHEKMEEIRARVGELVRDPATAEAMRPWYNYLCKRPLYSDEFLQAFNRDNVTLVDTAGQGVERIDATGLWANGRHWPADCIIFATGFDVGAAAHQVGGYELIGRDGLTIDEKWRDGVRTVHGTQMHGFPNLHIVGGTMQGTTAFNFTHTLDMQAEHAVALIVKGMTERLRTLEVTAAAEDRWLAELEAKYVDHQQFYEDCTPGFLNNEGNFRGKPTFVGGTYGAGPLAYEQVLAQWRQSGVENDLAVTPEIAR